MHPDDFDIDCEEDGWDDIADEQAGGSAEDDAHQMGSDEPEVETGVDLGLGAAGIAMALGLGEEMAEEREEYARFEDENRRTEREYEVFNSGSRGLLSEERATRDPFRAWVRDVASGRKTLDDPIDYDDGIRWDTYMEMPGGNTSMLMIRNVTMMNSHLVSKRFLNFIGVLLAAYENPGPDSIEFHAEGGPEKDGRGLFGTYDASTRTIVFNLMRHLENGMTFARLDENRQSIHAIIWHSMILTFLHELYHSMTIPVYRGERRPDSDADEDKAASWSRQELFLVARRIDIEPPGLADDPYFGPRIGMFIDLALADGKADWARRQKEMLDSGLIFRDDEDRVEIRTMKEYYRITSLLEIENREHARVHASVKREIERMKKWIVEHS